MSFVPHHELTGPADAPALVLASSLGTSSAMWLPQVPSLSHHFRVVRFDTRGHGRSASPPGPYSIADLGTDVLAVFDALGLERASICGVSIGGMTALWLAANHPERIERMAVCCTSAYLPPPAAWQQRAEVVLEARSTEPIADAVVDRWLTPDYALEHRQTRSWLRGLLTATDPDGYAGCCAAIEHMDLRDELPRITCPTLVVSSPDDTAIAPQHSDEIAAAIPGAELARLDSGAHIPTVECAEEVNALLLGHFS